MAKSKAREKEFQDFFNRLPETGTPLINWHKWLIRNHFNLEIINVDHKTDELITQYRRDNKGKRSHYIISIIVKSNTSVYYLRNKLIDYLKYEKKYKTAPIVFKEYDKIIEEKNINYFTVRIEYYNFIRKEDITVY